MDEKDEVYSSGKYIYSENGELLFEMENPLTLKKMEGEKLLLVGKAYDRKNKRMCFLKCTNSENCYWDSLKREIRFQFYYPYIEHTYFVFEGVLKNRESLYAVEEKDDSEAPVFGVCVECVHGQTLEKASDNLHRAAEEGTLTEEEEEKIVFRQMLELLLGMECYMEQTKVPNLHRDIKGSNIMITEEEMENGRKGIPGSGHVKIIDFDSSHVNASKETVKGRAGGFGYTPGFTSPHAYTAITREKSPNKCDEIYSVGRVFFICLNNGKHYFNDLELKKESWKNETSGYGVEKSRFVPKYLDPKTGEFKEKYKRLLEILTKMCCNPEKETPYASVTEVIEDFSKFLEAYYGANWKAEIGADQLPLLQAKRKGSYPKEENAVWVGTTVLNDRMSGTRGKDLYEYCMRNVELEGQISMVVYNLGGKIYYIPVKKIELCGGRRNERAVNEEYRIYDQDIFVNETGTKIQFSIDG